MHILGSTFITILFCGVFQPITLHLILHEEGLLHGVFNTSPSIATHLASSTVGLIGAIFLGSRLLKLRELDRCSVSLESPSNTFTGYFLVLLGLIASVLPEDCETDVLDAILLTNCIVAAGGALMAFFLLHSVFDCGRFGYWHLIRWLQSAVASLVAVSFGAQEYLPSGAFVVGVVASASFYLTVLIVNMTALEDNCNVMAIHFIGSLVGVFSLPLLSKRETLSGNLRLAKSGWQLIYSFVVVTSFAIIFSIFFGLLKATGLLRSKQEKLNHGRAIRLRRKNRKSCCERLSRRASLSSSERSSLLARKKSDKTVQFSLPTQDQLSQSSV